MISKNNNFFQGNEYQSNIQITCSDVYALQKKKKRKKKWRILLRISSVFCAVSFIKDNHNRLGFSMEHFAQIYLLSHEIYTNRLIMCVNFTSRTGFLDKIPFKRSFSLKDTFLITCKSFPVKARRDIFRKWDLSNFYKLGINRIIQAKQAKIDVQ